ncbi:hypothetical protein [Chryseobacterium luteum]|uniref:hypothetical protein n=1 Tax=Chryseobacterium luteum TaxID=421531 RepID=UPI000B0B229F|nr:hypothetical protein [Chryseobacterium luteum]
MGAFNFKEFGINANALWRINNVFCYKNKIGLQLRSDSAVSNSEFSRGDIPINITDGGNRLTNIWCNSGKEGCLRIKPLNSSVNLRNTSISNLYIGEVYGEGNEVKPIINIEGLLVNNVQHRVFDVQISNSFITNAEGAVSIPNDLVSIKYAENIVFSNCNFFGQGLYASSNRYTRHAFYIENSSMILINNCTITGINKSSLKVQKICSDISISNCTFNGWGQAVANGDDFICLYFSDEIYRTQIIGCNFIDSSSNLNLSLIKSYSEPNNFTF